MTVVLLLLVLCMVGSVYIQKVIDLRLTLALLELMVSSIRLSVISVKLSRALEYSTPSDLPSDCN